MPLFCHCDETGPHLRPKWQSSAASIGRVRAGASTPFCSLTHLSAFALGIHPPASVVVASRCIKGAGTPRDVTPSLSAHRSSL